MKLCTKVLGYLKIIKQVDANNVRPLMAVILNSKMAAKITILFTQISCSTSPRTTIQMSGNLLAVSEFTSEGRHIGFQDDHHMFHISSYLTCTYEEKSRLCAHIRRLRGDQIEVFKILNGY